MCNQMYAAAVTLIKQPLSCDFISHSIIYA